MLEKIFEGYRPTPSYPTYPPYHTGLYLEDYFYDWYYKNDIDTQRILIPVSWTTCYIESRDSGLQEILDSLDQSKKYFSVCQFDDGIKHSLPKDTIQFNAGGNSGGIPVPLICSKIPAEDIEKFKSEKTKLCSFTGSLTHPIRSKMYNEFIDKSDCEIFVKQWNASVKENEYESYLSSALKSKFLLCPRGYGLNSFRLYEAFQLGCVPVIISDNMFLPWEDELDWSEFSVLANNCERLHFNLENISDSSYNTMLEVGQQLFKDYFSLEGMCKQIVKREDYK